MQTDHFKVRRVRAVSQPAAPAASAGSHAGRGRPPVPSPAVTRQSRTEELS
jgi:hypothetical protein